MKFRITINEAVKYNLDIKKIKTKSNTSSGWYSPSTTYNIDSVSDGHYDKKPGVIIGDKFIPEIDIETNLRK